MPSKINFSVDARLLQELGEGLVGKPSTALAELIKNAYDADATLVEVLFEPEWGDSKGRIIVRDNGHGMTFEDFQNFWMRIGTKHKTESGKTYSKYFNRRMTGSKGIGRLSVQFLAHQLELITVPKDIGKWILAKVDWDQAIQAGDLTKASVEYEIREPPLPFPSGTELRLMLLKEKERWNSNELKNLAREIWWLQPPFRRNIESLPAEERFEIRFIGAEEYFKEFQEQLDAILEIQTARILGRYSEGRAQVAIEFWERRQIVETFKYQYSLEDIADPEYHGKYDPERNLHQAEFEIRIYKAEGRLPSGILVDTLREYLERFAGVHVYDGHFRLPYYGIPENDWLKVEYDHSRRMFESRLLPKSIQDSFKDTERLRYLPTLRRMIGVVKVNTNLEKSLKIQITRDRLVEGQAHDDLRYVVRYALDLYAYHAARKALLKKQSNNPTERSVWELHELEDLVERSKDLIPQDTYLALANGLKQVYKKVLETEKVMKESELTRLSVIAPLATAGMAALTIQHELRKQFGTLEQIVLTLESFLEKNETKENQLASALVELRKWLERARMTNRLFDYMTGETMKERQRYRAKVVVESIFEQMSFMAEGVRLDTSNLDDELYLPEASFAEWGSIFQNVFSNAFNAMLGLPNRLLAISSKKKDNQRILLVQDTGRGVDLNDAERLFEPFERGIHSNTVLMRIGYGGTGLGLTIVRLLCERIGCYARFVNPEPGFSTAFCLEWEEKKRRVVR